MLKVELHTHTADDPIDRIPHTTHELIDRAAELRYDAVAITLHDRQLDLDPYVRYAYERGIVLIPGIERTIEGKHVLLLNFREGTEDVATFDDLAHLRRVSSGIVVAPHPYFPGSTCLRDRLDEHADLFDAVEWNGMFMPGVNFNLKAEAWAKARGKTLVGNGDVHRLRQLGTTYSLVDAEPNADAICAAVLAGRVEVRATPHSPLTAGAIISELFAEHLVSRWIRAPRTPSRDPIRAA